MSLVERPLGCIKVVFRGSAKLKKELTKCGQRVCLTTDCWTSCTQMAYMCLTAHYIDSDWRLHKKIVNFCQIENHKGETIGKVIETCYLVGDWKGFLVSLLIMHPLTM